MNATEQPQKDPVHMDADGQWYFYDESGAYRYGPYATPDLARSGLRDYAAWLNQQAGAPQSAQEEQPQSPLEQAVAEYIATRDAKSELEAKHKAELADLNERLERLDAFLLGNLQDLGVDSFKTGMGTVFTTQRMQAQVPDKGALTDYLRNNPDDIELLQTRISTTVLKDWMEKHNGATPPGVAARIERTVSVRRKN